MRNLDLTPHDHLCFQLRTFQPKRRNLDASLPKPLAMQAPRTVNDRRGAKDRIKNIYTPED